MRLKIAAQLIGIGLFGAIIGYVASQRSVVEALVLLAVIVAVVAVSAANHLKAVDKALDRLNGIKDE